MRVDRLYTDQPLAAGARVSLDERPARHAVQVLRLAAAAPLVLFNGDGFDYRGEIEHAGRNGVVVRLSEAGPPEPPLALRITLALGVSKGERMDLSIQKAVELGVGALQPLTTARSVVRLDAERRDRRHQHWQGIVIAACEQSGRRRLPELAPVRGIDDWLPGAGGGVLLDHRAALALPSLPPPGAAITLLIGPEGGLSPTEREAAHRHGFTGVRLGPRVLRTETAPLAAIAVIQALWGDFRD